jgi:hypothetical protein
MRPTFAPLLAPPGCPRKIRYIVYISFIKYSIGDAERDYRLRKREQLWRRPMTLDDGSAAKAGIATYTSVDAEQERTLLPMLVIGLVLAVIGALAIMAFV